MYHCLFTAKLAGAVLVPDALSEPPQPQPSPSPTPAPVPFRSGGQAQHTRNVSQLTGSLRLLRDRSISVQAAQGRTRTIFIPAVPAILGASDLCSFLGSLMPSIEHMRFLRTDGVLGRYSVLLRFATQEAADRCFRGYNGRPFSSLLDPSVVCRALFVGSARVEWAGEGPPPGLLENDALRLDSEGGAEWGPGAAPASASAAASAAGSAAAAPSASGALVELPSCPVCLERLDSSASGLLTTLCQHSFHSDCLSRWAGSDACPVCRYCLWHDDLEAQQQEGGAGSSSSSSSAAAMGGGSGSAGAVAAAVDGPAGSTAAAANDAASVTSSTSSSSSSSSSSSASAAAVPPASTAPSSYADSLGDGSSEGSSASHLPSAPATDAAQRASPPPYHQVSHQHVACESCGLFTDLWMCLVCGCVGCGRYSGQHQIEHWRSSGHCYAIELSSQRVWDYASDSYVHRLLQNRADGKLVELPDAAGPDASAPTRGGGAGSSAASQTGGATSQDLDDDCGRGSAARTALAAAASARADKDAATSAPSLPHPPDQASDPTALSPYQRMESIAFEYTLLLTSQLESQRMYFEGMLSSLVALTASTAPAAERKQAAEAVLYRHHGGSSGGSAAAAAAMDACLTERESRALKNDLAAAKAACAAAEAKCSALESERRAALRRATALAERVGALEGELSEAKAMEEAHAADRSAWERRVAEAEKRCGEAGSRDAEEVAELREQVRDLMLTLDVQARMAKEGQEAVEGTVVSVAVKPGAGAGAGGGAGASGGGASGGGKGSGKKK